jgi:hypothetical protein
VGGHLENIAVCQEWDNHVSYRFEVFEEMRRIDKLWKIMEYRASFLSMFNCL